MKSATSKVVTALDVTVVVLATSAGALCGLWSVRGTQELNTRLRKIDNALHPYCNMVRDRIRAVLIIVLPLLTICILLGLDFWTWSRFAGDNNDGDEKAELNVQWYLPFYSLYLILTGLHIGFAHTAFGLGRRYNRLNTMLESTFLLNDNNNKNTSVNTTIAATKPKIITVKTLSELHPQLPLQAGLAKLAADENVQNESSSKTKGILIKLLAENHESLGKCVTIVSHSYGIAVLFILVSCLLHLVATSYFLFLELLKTKNDTGFVGLQILWITFHTLRLLMVVEPCHSATVESKKTIQIICEIERRVYDPILIEGIKKFWQQLLVVHSEFSACGLCRVNRNILTSFSSAIATYLVILIQFQKSNG